MKTIKKTIYLSLVCLALIVTGCSKSDDDGAAANNPTGGSGGDEYLTARVDGSVFEAAQTPAVIVAATTSNNVLTLQGGQNDGRTIRATINGYNGVGTYIAGNDISNPNSMSYITITPIATWMSTFNIGSGTLEVTSDDGTTIIGTFSFEGFNAQDQTTKNITEGTFKATID